MSSRMSSRIDAAGVAALDDERIDWRFNGLPASWSGRTPAQICRQAPNLFDDAAASPVCVLRLTALAHNM